MGLQTILSLIEEETEEEIIGIRRAAEERCEEIRRTALQKTEDEWNRIRRDGERRGEVLERKILLQAEYNSMKAVRDARWSGIHAAFMAAEEVLEALPSSPEYPTILRNQIIEGRSIVGGGVITVLCRSVDRMEVEKAIEGLEDVVIQPLPAHDPMIRSGGVILLSDDGRVRCDQTFSTRLSQMKDTLTQRISRILYGGGDDGS